MEPFYKHVFLEPHLVIFEIKKKKIVFAHVPIWLPLFAYIQPAYGGIQTHKWSWAFCPNP